MVQGKAFYLTATFSVLRNIDTAFRFKLKYLQVFAVDQLRRYNICMRLRELKSWRTLT